MSQPIISFENIGKKYRISHQVQRQRRTAFREVMRQMVEAERVL
jgi:hypothetical protein